MIWIFSAVCLIDSIDEVESYHDLLVVSFVLRHGTGSEGHVLSNGRQRLPPWLLAH